MKTLFIVSLLQIAVLCQQVINSPIKDEGSSQFPYKIADFGDIPWGQKFTGSLALAYPLDACQPIEDLYKDFVLIERGNCTFTTKVRNAQKAGYSLAIIYDNQPKQEKEISLTDDGTGFSVKIPSIFIDQQSGEKLKNDLNKYLFNLQEPLDIILSLQFEDKIQNKVVLGLDLMNNKTFEFLREFEIYQEQLEQLKIKVEIQYQIFSIPSYIKDSAVQKNCLGNGMYCANAYNKTNKGTGHDIILEILRELCIFNVSPKLWFNYMKYFNQICSEVESFQKCSNDIRKLLEIDDVQFDVCYVSSFYDPNTYKTVIYPTQDLNQLPNLLLDYQLDLATKTSIRDYPSVAINGQLYRGRLYAQAVFDEIRSGHKETPSVCDQNKEDIKQNNLLANSQSTSHSNTVTIIVALIVLLFIIGFVISKKIMNKSNNINSNNTKNQELQEVM